MADYRIKLTDTINFNLSLGGMSPDVGITYSLPGDFANSGTLTAGGLFTPSATGLTVVEAKNASGVVIRRFSIEVIPVAEATLEEAVGANTASVNPLVKSPTSPAVIPPKAYAVAADQTGGAGSGDSGTGAGAGGAGSGTGGSGSGDQTGGAGSGSSGTGTGSGGVTTPTVPAPTNFGGYQNRAYGSGPDIDWSWTSVQGYTYEYYIGALNAPTPASGTPTSGYYVTGMGSVARGTTAKAWVRAKNSDNQYSDWVTATQTVPVMDTPVFQGEGLSATGSVSWWGVTGASNYDYQITTSATPGPTWSNTPNNWIHNINMSQYAGQTVYVFVRAGSTANNPTSAENNPYATSSRAVPA